MSIQFIPYFTEIAYEFIEVLRAFSEVGTRSALTS